MLAFPPRRGNNGKKCEGLAIGLARMEGYRGDDMKNLLLWGLCCLLFAGCFGKKKLGEKMREAIKEDPTIITDAFEEHPEEFLKAISSLAGARRKLEQQKEEKAREKEYENPKKPLIRPDETIRGTKGAPLVLVEYSDFECPYCTRGLNTVRKLLKKYEGKMQFIYKHLPLDFHPNAMLASRYYEAIRLQNEKKAFQFHDEIFDNQKKLKKGEAFLKPLAKKLNVNMAKLAKDINSSKVKDRIKQDMEEAAKLGFQGTPGFLLNGISVRGAYPAEHFDKIVEKLAEMGKISL